MGSVQSFDLGGTLSDIDDAGRTKFIICVALDDNDDAGNDCAGINSAIQGTGSCHPRWTVTRMNASHRWPKPCASTLPSPRVRGKRGVMKFDAPGAIWVPNTGFRVTTDLLNR